METAIAAGAGIIVGLGAAFAGSVWAAKDFRRRSRLATYEAFVQAFLAATRENPSSETLAAFEDSYFRVCLVASDAGRARAAALREMVGRSDANGGAALTFCDAVRGDIINWWPN
jgi:anti-sigma regulatory factor (Ser/Thr protein kinase)